ncbi:dUTP diphosphatase [Leucobacter sp. M11]|uniref:dUTP diphosphatase n=1 Tax=Leucobacter sp. M11 TaxID=2993565 RepID=UPI002D8067EA|nr:dUTP diphosphatase [Leucobacter sp. M11]MEB4614019.1 dUTP diphosphatase [Leucobacter sp. M11]
MDIPFTGARPLRAHKTDAGYDLRTKHGARIPAGSRHLFSTGVSLALPADTVALVCSRSGLAMHHGVVVLNAPGIIDAGYRGDIGVLLVNHGHEAYTVAEGDKIAQLVILGLQPVRLVRQDELPPADRGPNGFGSTGT